MIYTNEKDRLTAFRIINAGDIVLYSVNGTLHYSKAKAPAYYNSDTASPAWELELEDCVLTCDESFRGIMMTKDEFLSIIRHNDIGQDSVIADIISYIADTAAKNPAITQKDCVQTANVLLKSVDSIRKASLENILFVEESRLNTELPSLALPKEQWYHIGVSWTMHAVIDVKALCWDEAYRMAADMSADMSCPTDCEYEPDSFMIDEDSCDTEPYDTYVHNTRIEMRDGKTYLTQLP